MSWQNILKALNPRERAEVEEFAPHEMNLKADAQKTWIPYVVDMFRNSPERTMTAKTVMDNLIDNSTLSGSTKNLTQLKYRSIPTRNKIYAFLMSDDRFRTIENRKSNEFIWAGDEEE